MPSLTWTKKHVKVVADVLDQEHETLEDAAKVALDAALSIIEDRAKWAVVGQVVETPEHGKIKPDHEAAVKVCLGMFPSETLANDAAMQMTSNTAGDRLATWVVPTFFGTPAAWHVTRREYYRDLEDKAAEKHREKLRASIEKRRIAAQERADNIRAMEAASGQHWPCPTAWAKRGDCRHDPACK